MKIHMEIHLNGSHPIHQHGKLRMLEPPYKVIRVHYVALMGMKVVQVHKIEFKDAALQGCT